MKSTYVPFKETKTFDERKIESSNIVSKYPDRLPIIVETAGTLVLDKHKYLVPMDLTVGQFMYVIRKRLHLTSEAAIFLFINDILPPTSAQLSQVYYDNRDADGFLYCKVMKENTFG